jgi:hypothetical protein
MIIMRWVCLEAGAGEVAPGVYMGEGVLEGIAIFSMICHSRDVIGSPAEVWRGY